MKPYLNSVRDCSRAFLIAAPHSGSGKTTVACGLMALYKQKGYTVQPFKCGPDYIDTKFHERVCGRPSVNLDTFFASEEHLRDLFTHYTEDANIAIVEGMMGLYDGYDRDRGSSAEIARILGLPIVLVVDARSAAYSMAALLQGFIGFRSGLTYAGVIFNKVSSERHAAMLRQVCDDLHIPCLGCLPKSADLEVGSRYLGLDFSAQQTLSKEGGLSPDETLVSLLEKNIEWERLIGGEKREARNERIGDNLQSSDVASIHDSLSTLHDTNILIARNSESFSFLYQETLDRLATLGHVEFFDPEDNNYELCIMNYALLYLPGGYPEKHLEALVMSEATRKAIKEYAERGGRIIAECGGMMYLCQSIVTDDGEYSMCGVLPYKISARKADRKLSLGYRQFTLDGKAYRGHEFHYTQFMGDTPPSIVQVYNAKGEAVPTPILRYKNVFASYTHLYNMLDLL